MLEEPEGEVEIEFLDELGVGGEPRVGEIGHVVEGPVGGEGDDEMFGEDGDDAMYGEWGDDSIDGGSGNDTIYGFVGDDSIDGGTGYDVLYGGAGEDLIIYGAGNDNVMGESGNDTLRAGAGDALAVGFLVSYVLGGCSLDDAVLRGQIAARHTCAQRASSSHLITAEALERHCAAMAR